MAETSWSIGLASGNSVKIAQFNNAILPNDRRQLPTMFDENKIKNRVAALSSTGIPYFANVALLKLESQREGLVREQAEADYAVMVSDSGAYVQLEDGSYQVINRDDPEQKTATAPIVERDGIVQYVGNLAFGRKDGKANYLVTTYCDTTIRQGIHLETFPNTDELPDIAIDQEPFEYGYIEYRFGDNGELVPVKRPLGRTNDYGLARPYISGLTPEVIRFASEVSYVDSQVGPILQELVRKYPFNDLGYYSAFNTSGLRSLEEFYQHLAEEWRDFFERCGGNCSLFSLELINKLRQQGFSNDHRVLVFPSQRFTNGEVKTIYEFGHSSVLFGTPNSASNTKYFADPGLAIPFPIPIDTSIPVFPVGYGDGKFAVMKVERDLTDKVPNLMIRHRNGRLAYFNGRVVMTEGEFRASLADILFHLHEPKDVVKLDFHNEVGNILLGLAFNRRNGTISIPVLGIRDVALQNILDNEQHRSLILEKCQAVGVDAQIVLGQLEGLL